MISPKLKASMGLVAAFGLDEAIRTDKFLNRSCKFSEGGSTIFLKMDGRWTFPVPRRQMPSGCSGLGVSSEICFMVLGRLSVST